METISRIDKEIAQKVEQNKRKFFRVTRFALKLSSRSFSLEFVKSKIEKEQKIVITQRIMMAEWPERIFVCSLLVIREFSNLT